MYKSKMEVEVPSVEMIFLFRISSTNTTVEKEVAKASDPPIPDNRKQPAYVQLVVALNSEPNEMDPPSTITL